MIAYFVKQTSDRSFDLIKLPFKTTIEKKKVIKLLEDFSKLLNPISAFITDEEGFLLEEIFFEKNLN